MISIFRGATPVVKITLPESVKVTDFEKAYLVFSQQNEPKIEKELSELIVSTENNSVSCQLDQADTLSFEVGLVQYQLTFLMNDNQRYFTNLFNFRVEKSAKDVVI